MAASGRLDLDAPSTASCSRTSAAALVAETSLRRLFSHRGGLAAWGGLYFDVLHEIGSGAARRWIISEAARRGSELPAGTPERSDLGYIVAGEALGAGGGRRARTRGLARGARAARDRRRRRLPERAGGRAAGRVHPRGRADRALPVAQSALARGSAGRERGCAGWRGGARGPLRQRALGGALRPGRARRAARSGHAAAGAPDGRSARGSR